MTAGKTGKVLWPLAVGVAFLAVWQLGGIHALLHFKPFQLPVPLTILETVIDNLPKMLSDTWITASGALTGMIIGSLLGFLVAVIATMFPKWGYPGLTLVSLFNAIPIVALSPIMNRWFDDGFGQKVGVVTVVCMATMAINSYRGLNDLRPFTLDLMDSYAAPGSAKFFKLRLPNSLPSIFTALKINIANGLIAAMISEYFASSTAGLGFSIKDNLRKAMMAKGWSCIVMAALVGMLLYSVLTLVERRAVKWHASQNK
jgi:NitT/TauT family transport system permease protein